MDGLPVPSTDRLKNAAAPTVRTSPSASPYSRPLTKRVCEMVLSLRTPVTALVDAGRGANEA